MALSTLAGFQAAAQTETRDAPGLEEIVVTGSRIVRKDFVANSPLTSLSGDQLTANADITLESALNTLPQVNPAGTSTSNNPGNNGQANIDLRGFGTNRNLVLIDGRRPMVSDNSLTVDINTIPAALIERVEVITGGAGAAYGADAISGVVNFILKDDFEGVDLRASWSDATESWDAREYGVSAVFGGNFADGRGNAVLSVDKAEREALIKAQRPFAKLATSTTGAPPEGNLRNNATNPFPLAAVQQVFARYGVTPDQVSLAGGLGFNTDGTLFYNGVFNSPLDVRNFRGPVGDGVNTRFFPDFYSYNFDAVNLLTLPLNRDSVTGRVSYETDSGIKVFGGLSWTEYRSTTALAPTPVGQGTVRPANNVTDSTQVISALVTPGQSFTGGLLIPVTNPFIPADLRTLLNARTGDDPRLVGSGASEPFFIGSRLVAAGLRRQSFENTVTSAHVGLRGPILDSGYTWEVSASEGRTEIDDTQSGNINNQRLFDLLAAADGGRSICAGGLNLFGNNPISAECIRHLQVQTQTTTELRQQIVQGFVTGDVFELPAGPLSAVLGLEYRGFSYDFDPGPLTGAVVGFNTATRDKGSNRFRDIFGEVLAPLVRDEPWARSLELSLGWRYSTSDFVDEVRTVKKDLGGSHAYKAELSWAVDDQVRVRGSYQRSVRAPNFDELFVGGSNFPQVFDPCSANSDLRRGPNGAAVRALCTAGGVAAASVDSFIATPGNQVFSENGGNLDLSPERGDTLTGGIVITPSVDSPWLDNLTLTADYWNIDIRDAILRVNPNDLIAGCFNYHGANPTYDPQNALCRGLARSGGNLFNASDVASADGRFLLRNGGRQKGSGIDIQVDHRLDLDGVGIDGGGDVRTNLVLTHLIGWEQKVAPWAPMLDYAGTIGYFGAALGQSFPTWKATGSLAWSLDPVTTSVRARYIGAMKSRAAVEYKGETSFTGPEAVWYVDASVGIDLTDGVSLTAGVNNVFDRKPPQFQPNMQSGTDPSTYDVIGRRLFVTMRATF